MDWIRVKDRLPEEDKKVLSIWAGGTNGVEMITVCWNKQRGWYNDDLSIKNSYIITYWSDIPMYPNEFWN